MALFTPSQSPAVVVKEIDATGGVPNVQTSTGAYVGNFRWGPVEEPTLVSGEAGLVEIFGTPKEDNAMHLDFTSCVQFLQYSNSLRVVRMIDSGAKNAVAARGAQQDSGGAAMFPTDHTAQVVKNDGHYLGQEAGLITDNVAFISKYPGTLGNSLVVEMCFANKSGYDGWAYKNSFDGKPGTSVYASNNDATGDEVHLVVVDSDGAISGTKGQVLEVFPFMSLAKDGRNPEGVSTFLPTVINETSEYIKMPQFYDQFTNDSHPNSGLSAGTLTTIGTAKTYYDSSYDSANGLSIIDSGVFKTHFTGGADNTASLTTGLIETGFDTMSDKETIEVDYLIAPSFATSSDQKTAVNALVTLAENTRKDCVVLASPARDDVVGQASASTITDNIVNTANTFTKSSYLIMDGNFVKAYDKFNDKYHEIPGAAATAGLLAATDRNFAPWFSPAGNRRGRYFNIAGINYNPDKSQRDQLYRANVNPIANIVGQGILLYGDKTMLGRSSAFDRINVRRLFLVLERAIAEAAKNVLFEFNDEFTRTEFVNVIEPVLRDVKGRRGITDFRVIADETVNTPEVIDRNEFIANIFIKPARSINFVTLNFVAVRTGVDFNEVVGTVGV
tara:strand:+ start:1211 stop:3055 length:1845 start_codon:yes stop_codon:yes gene_type:complete